jgi:peptide/nickel transport system substrate-binding protein
MNTRAINRIAIVVIIIILIILGSTVFLLIQQKPAQTTTTTTTTGLTTSTLTTSTTTIVPQIPNPDTLIVEDIGEPQYLDPAVDYETVGAEIITNVYETLVWYNGTNSSQIVPWLAER